MVNNGSGPTMMKISSLLPQLPLSESKVGKVILEDAERVIYFSVSELARLAGVGESTVLRFCRKLGFKGYQEFKLVLAQELVRPFENLNREIGENDSIETIAQKVTDLNIQVLRESLALLDIDQLGKACEAILNCNRLLFFGVGDSGITALEAKQRFFRIGFQAEAYNDLHFQVMAASFLTERDVAVGISRSGSTKDTIETLKVAKGTGARTIAITNVSYSPITKVADIVLTGAVKESPLEGGSLTGKMAQLLMLDILFTSVAVRMQGRVLQFIEKAARAVSTRAY